MGGQFASSHPCASAVVSGSFIVRHRHMGGGNQRPLLRPSSARHSPPPRTLHLPFWTAGATHLPVAVGSIHRFVPALTSRVLQSSSAFVGVAARVGGGARGLCSERGQQVGGEWRGGGRSRSSADRGVAPKPKALKSLGRSAHCSRHTSARLVLSPTPPQSLPPCVASPPALPAGRHALRSRVPGQGRSEWSPRCG